MMRLSEAMAIPRGVTAIVGGGGKTALMTRLAEELSRDHRVLMTTTAHIRPPACETLLSPTPEEVTRAFCRTNLLAAGTLASEGKLGEAASLRNCLPELADYVLVEADGSRGLPLKAPADHEPALPPCPGLVIAVAGVSGLNRPILEAAHRPERYAALLQATPESLVAPRDAALVLESPQGQRKGVTGRFLVVLNQVDTPERLALARECARSLHAETFLLALQTRPNWLEHWRDGACLCSSREPEI